MKCPTCRKEATYKGAYDNKRVYRCPTCGAFEIIV